jgi:hypothetical protein
MIAKGKPYFCRVSRQSVLNGLKEVKYPQNQLSEKGRAGLEVRLDAS